MKINRSNTLTNRNIDPILIAVKLVFLRCRSVRPAWFQPLRHCRGFGTSTLITPRKKTPCLSFRKSRRLLSALRLNAQKDSGHCRKIGTVHRLSSTGRAVFVSQSLSGLRSSQSQPHGCFQRSGFAAGEPARSAISVLGGFATSSAPAFPSSCAAAMRVPDAKSRHENFY